MTLLRNGNFEADWDEQKSHRCLIIPEDDLPYEMDVSNIFTPPFWVTWFFGQPDAWDQPEVRDAWKTLDLRRVHSGEKGMLLFTFYRNHDAGFLQQVVIEPGTLLRLTAHAHAWSNNKDPEHPERFPHPDDPCWSEGAGYQEVAWKADSQPITGDPQQDAKSNFLFVVGIDPTGGQDPYADTVVWGQGYHIYNGYHPLTVEATAQNQIVTVFLRSVTMWPFKHNDAYWDDVTLEVVTSPEGRGKPRVQYARLYTLLPPSADKAWAHAVVEATWDRFRVTLGGSADDAGIGDLDTRRVLAINPDLWPGDLVAFFEQYYPEVEVHPVLASTPEELQRKLSKTSKILLWQCDPEWRDDKIAGSACNKTLCQVGCWIADCAMAQRYLGVDPDATPRTANILLGPEGFSGCNCLWSKMPRVGLEVVKRTHDQQEVCEWLDAGNVCFAEVAPASLEHFVMVTRHSEGRFWMYDPYENQEGWVDHIYSGIESWRLIRKASEVPPPPPPPPSIGNPIGLHLQSMSPGWEDYVRDAKPSVMKVLASMHDVVGVKSVRPETLVIWRHVDNNYSGILDNPDPHAGARKWIAKFRDSLYDRCDRLAQIPGITEPYFYVESINEVYPSLNEAAIRQAVNFDIAFIEELEALGLPVKAVVFTAGIGNPHETEYPLLVPLARAAEQHGALLGYHNYWWANRGISHLDSDWKWHAGRWTEMDKVFVARGIHVLWFGAESGVHYSCVDGWKAQTCYNRDWSKYRTDILRIADRIRTWNASHNNRYLGLVLFTTGGPGWDSWEIQRPEMESLTQVLQLPQARWGAQ